MHETFWTLLKDTAHWEFEIFLMVLFDGVIVGLAWPFVRKHWKHHVSRDQQDKVYQHQDWGISPKPLYIGDEILFSGPAADPKEWPEEYLNQRPT